MIDLTKFHFSIIYSVDVPAGVMLAHHRPPHFQKREWYVTESGESEYAYLEGDWANGSRHRKYCNILNFADFCEFIERCDLNAQRCQTMGSIGAPGCGFGLAPAVSFDGQSNEALLNAYVTPIPPEMMSDYESPGPLLTGMPDDLLDPVWEDIEAVMWDWFDDGYWSATEKAEEVGVLIE